MITIATTTLNEQHHQPAHNTATIARRFLTAASLCLLASCSIFSSTHTHIQGYALEQQPLANAEVTLRTADGQTYTTLSDSQGFYQLQLRNARAPFLVSLTSEPGRAGDCARNDVLRPICLASVILERKPTTLAHINPLSDRLVSDIAVRLGYSGPQQWVDAAQPAKADEQSLRAAQRNLARGFGDALQQAGISASPNHFDPARYPLASQPNMRELMALLHHNRNYDNPSGRTGHTTLTDISFRPIVGLKGDGAYEPFNFARARHEYQQLNAAHTRIFIVGDSTSAMYEKLRYPRAGWGQLFREQFAPNSGVVVVVGSRAGRSSRDFYNGRWFAQMERFIQPGDYVFINHGHNDQNCDAAKATRGAPDVLNLCTYPNNTEGLPQFPAGQPELSFQHSLERYITIAKARGAQAILFTPTTRIKNAQGEQDTPVVPSHITRASSGKHYLFTGDYSQTIKDTARKHQLPLIDLEARSIALANRLGSSGWQDYWLVVDPAINAFYANGAPGSPQAPDGTHFQERGARAIAELVAAELRTQEIFAPLKNHLK